LEIHAASKAASQKRWRPKEPPPSGVFFRLDLSRGAPYRGSEYVKKALWRLVQATLFRIARPRQRATLLRLFGADMHPTAHLRGSVRVHHPWLLRMGAYSNLGEDVQVYNLGPVVIGDHTSVSQGVHLCAGTHEWRTPSMALVRSSITIGSGVWVCADAFIGPNVRIGNNCVVAARAVVLSDVLDGVIVMGNPAAVVKKRPMGEPAPAPAKVDQGAASAA